MTPPDDEPTEVASERAAALTRHIETVLCEVVHATDDWPMHHLLQRLRRLVRAERARRADADPGKTTIGERVLGFARVPAGYYAAQEKMPEKVAGLRRALEVYDADLRSLRLEDYDLDRNPKVGTRWLALLTTLQFILVFFLLPPIVLIGSLVNIPPALLLMGAARVASRQQKDEATVKLLLGALATPVTWIATGVATGFGHAALHEAYPQIPNGPIFAGVLAGALAAVGGIVALRYVRLVRETARAIRVRFTRRRSWLSITRLRVERGRIHDHALALVEGVLLPGDVLPDGRIVADASVPDPREPTELEARAAVAETAEGDGHQV